jgi:hypothetical protein
MISVEDCRRFADECERLAETAIGTPARAQYLKLAQTWRELADQQASGEPEPEPG